MNFKFRDAGNVSGGSLNFVIGLIMASAGFYMLLDNIIVTQSFGLGYALYHVAYGGGWNITAGSLLIPFMFGAGWIFYDPRAIWGWILAGGAICAVIFGVLMSLRIQIRSMSLLSLIIILVLLVGGLGLFVRSLRKA